MDLHSNKCLENVLLFVVFFCEFDCSILGTCGIVTMSLVSPVVVGSVTVVGVKQVDVLVVVTGQEL